MIYPLHVPSFKKSLLGITLFIFWLVLYLAGLRDYAGSKIIFTIFSLVYLCLIYSGVYKLTSFSYLFLCIFLWLGFWFKLCANFLWLGFFPYGEPIGNFDGAPASWDIVLCVAIALGAGMLVSHMALTITNIKLYKSVVWARAPVWYPPYRGYIWAATFLLIVGVALLNTSLGIHQIGLTPRTILIWPGNALISWFLNIGASLLVAVFVCWDVSLGRKTNFLIIPVISEAFISTISIISRASFPFHVIPQIIALWNNEEIRSKLLRKNLFVIFIIFLLLFLGTIYSVSYLRDYHYQNSKSLPIVVLPNKALKNSNVIEEKSSPVVQGSDKITSSFRWILIHQLLVNRWIGLEGVMAVSSFREKSYALLMQMFLEKRENGKVSMYQVVSNSGYQVRDVNYQFGSMPGMAGFLYYSGSMWLVFYISFGIGLIMVLSEKMILRITKNPIFCSIYGLTLANTIAQFGLAPINDLPMYIMIFVSASVIYLIQLTSNDSDSM